MKLTKEILKKIIKEELEAVMESTVPIFGIGVAAAAAKKRRAAKKSRDGRSAEEEQVRKQTLDRLNRMTARKPSTSPAPAPTPSTPSYMNYGNTGDSAEGLESLLRAKHAATKALGVDEDGDLPYVYIFGGANDGDVLSRYYNGDMDFQDAIDAAKAAGELGENDIDDESGGFSLAKLFPGK